MVEPHAIALARDDRHRYSKPQVPKLRVVAGDGVYGDAHRGITVQHRSRVVTDPG